MVIPTHQRTLDRAVSCSGIGLHSGKEVHLALKPAPINHGIKFVRKDLPDNPTIPARFNCVVDTSLATVIGSDGAIVSTIEHLMACFAGLSIDNVIVEIGLLRSAGNGRQCRPLYPDDTESRHPGAGG